jgi:hypothetical protein
LITGGLTPPMQKAPVAPPGFSLRAGFFIDHMGAASVGGLFHFGPLG